VTTTNVYIGNFFFVAGIGMLISAQWELVKGNSFAYTVLSAFGTLPRSSCPTQLTPCVQACSTQASAQSSLLHLASKMLMEETRLSTTTLSGFGYYVSVQACAQKLRTDHAPVWTVFNTFFLIASAPM
jgi:succinate-acetate transporter protein